MKKIVIFILIIGLMVTIFGIGCGRKEKKSDIIDIGVILPLTGPLSPQGERTLNGMHIALNEINSKNTNMRLIIEDSQTNPQIGLSAFNKLLHSEKVTAITGGISSSVVLACAPAVEKEHIIFLSSGATSPLITNAGENIFRLRLSGKSEVEAMAEFLIKKFQTDSIVVIYVNTDYGTGNFQAFKDRYTEMGGQIVHFESYEQGINDFKTIIAKIKSYESIPVYLIGHSIEMAHFLKTSKELGLDKKIYSTLGIESPEVIKIAGNAAESVVYTMQKFSPKSQKRTKEFSDKYYEEYGEYPDLFSALGYDSIKILYQTINDFGESTEAINKGFLAIKDYPGIIGPINFDHNGDVITEVMLKTVNNQNFVELQ